MTCQTNPPTKFTTISVKQDVAELVRELANRDFRTVSLQIEFLARYYIQHEGIEASASVKENACLNNS